jgi:RNA polymerase sigma factor (sigma-70 family)
MPLPPFQNLLDAHASGVHRFLAARVGATDADDLFQETFIAALRAYPSLTHGTNLEGWLMTIAHRKTLDLYRARGRAPVPVGDAAEERAPEDPAGEDGAVWSRVGGLPPRQRSAVALRFACELSYAEIAAVAGGSEAAARRNVHVGLKRLREEMTR